jgi:hypothetical protein
LYADDNRRDDHTPSSKIYHLIKTMEASGAAAVGDGTRGELDLRRVRERVLAKGFTADQFEQAIEEYSMLDVSFSTCNRNRVTLTVLNRSGKQRARGPGLFSSKLVTTIRTWMMTSELRNSSVGAGVPGYGESRRSEPTWSLVIYLRGRTWSLYSIQMKPYHISRP